MLPFAGRYKHHSLAGERTSWHWNSSVLAVPTANKLIVLGAANSGDDAEVSLSLLHAPLKTVRYLVTDKAGRDNSTQYYPEPPAEVKGGDIDEPCAEVLCQVSDTDLNLQCHCNIDLARWQGAIDNNVGRQPRAASRLPTITIYPHRTGAASRSRFAKCMGFDRIKLAWISMPLSVHPGLHPGRF